VGGGRGRRGSSSETSRKADGRTKQVKLTHVGTYTPTSGLGFEVILVLACYFKSIHQVSQVLHVSIITFTFHLFVPSLRN
jgi:hypothetical protein